MTRQQVVVVGAGPAGSSAAYHLARQGLRVILVDKVEFPREKACGDGITRRAYRQLERTGLDGKLRQIGTHAAMGLRICAPNGQSATLEPSAASAQPFARMVRRRDLDAALLDSAVSAGAQFMEKTRAVAMSTTEVGAQVHVISEDRQASLDCRLVIAADGSGGSFSRGTGLQRGKLLSIAARAYVSCEDQHEHLSDMLYESDVLPGYAWVFPLGEGICNVGIGIPASQAKRVNVIERLHALLANSTHIRDRLLNLRLLEPPRGGALYAGFRPGRTYGERLLAAGDAAGLVNPLTGSGISRALISGELAARQAEQAFASGRFDARALAAYGEVLRRRFGERHLRSRLLQLLFRSSRTVDRLVTLLNRDRSTMASASNFMSGGTDYVSLLSAGSVARLLLSPYNTRVVPGTGSAKRDQAAP